MSKLREKQPRGRSHLSEADGAVDKYNSVAVRWKLAVSAVDQTAHGAHERLFHARARYEQICKVLGDSRRCVADRNATLPIVLRIVRNVRRTDARPNQHERLEVQSSLERALLCSLARLQCSCFKSPSMRRTTSTCRRTPGPMSTIFNAASKRP
jgi:hypothetical protein